MFEYNNASVVFLLLQSSISHTDDPTWAFTNQTTFASHKKTMLSSTWDDLHLQVLLTGVCIPPPGSKAVTPTSSTRVAVDFGNWEDVWWCHGGFGSHLSPSLLFLITRRPAPEIRSWSGFHLRACHTNCCHVFRIWNSVGLRPGRYGQLCRTGLICSSRCATGLVTFASGVFCPLNVGVLHGTGSNSTSTLYLCGLLEFIFNSKATRLQNKMKKPTKHFWAF